MTRWVSKMSNFKSWSLIFAWTFLFGCSSQKLADLTFDVCLGSDGTTTSVVSIFQNTARKYGYEFRDNGAIQLGNLNRIDGYNRPQPAGIPLNFSIVEPSGHIVLTGGNLFHERALQVSFFYESTNENTYFKEDIMKQIYSIENSKVFKRDPGTPKESIEWNNVCAKWSQI